MLWSRYTLVGEYKKKVKDFRKTLTKEGFLRDSNLTLSGPRAERLWDYFNEQLDHGRVVFTNGGPRPAPLAAPSPPP